MSGVATGGRFAPWTTAFYAIAWIVVVVQGWAPLLGEDPLARLHYPIASAERLTSRDLELAEAIERTAGPLKGVLEALYGTRQEILLGAIDVQEEILAGLDESSVEADPVRERLRVLLEEAGHPEEASQWGTDDRARELLETREWRTVLEARRLLDYELGLADWYADRVLIALAVPDVADAARDDLLARGARWKRHSLLLLGSNLLLVAFGAALLATRVRFLRALFAGADGEPPWPLEDGLGVFVRGDFWNRLYFLTLTWAWGEPFGAALVDTAFGDLLQTWGTLIGSLPMLWLIHRHLLAPAGRSVVSTFGLGISPWTTIRIGLSAIAIDLVGIHAIAWTTWGLGVASSWAEGFDETLAWGHLGEAWMVATDYVVWVPAMEELAFRGLLYYSLRRRLGPAAAAALSAGFFASMHFYSLPGFLMTFWSGLVWALAFERSRSLLPGIGAHAVYNALYVAGVVLVYR